MLYPCEQCGTKFERYAGRGILCMACWAKKRTDAQQESWKRRYKEMAKKVKKK